MRLVAPIPPSAKKENAPLFSVEVAGRGKSKNASPDAPVLPGSTPSASDDRLPIETPNSGAPLARAQYLGEYKAAVLDDPLIRPAIAVSMGNRCQMYNRFGDALQADAALCKNALGNLPKAPAANARANAFGASQSDPPL